MSEEKLPNLIVTKVGIFNLQVCTTLTEKDEIEKGANRLSPAGTTHGWLLDERPEVAPVKCAEFPERMHYVLEC